MLPFSKRSEVKASFLKPEDKMNLIKATQPFERISIDFKGPLLSVSKNKYLLVIVDEFSSLYCNGFTVSVNVAK